MTVVSNEYGLKWLWSQTNVVSNDCGLKWMWSQMTVVSNDCGLKWKSLKWLWTQMKVVSNERGLKWICAQMNVVPNEQVSYECGLKWTGLKCRGLKWIVSNELVSIVCTPKSTKNVIVRIQSDPSPIQSSSLLSSCAALLFWVNAFHYQPFSCHVSIIVNSGVQRSGNARGDCLNLCLPAKFQYWAVAYDSHCYCIRAVCDVITWRHTFANQRFGEVCWHNKHIILHVLSLLVIAQRVKYSALQVRRPEPNTAINAKTEQFITAKISGNALKQGSRAHSVLRQRSLQLQKYKAAY